MKRTQYFRNMKPGVVNHLKRMNHDNTIQYFANDAGMWRVSCYTPEELAKQPFKRVTRDEARKFTPAAFRPTKKDRTIEPAPVTTKPGLETANKYRKALEGIDYQRTQKIAAIKIIRTIGYFGLAESLTIVENFDKFLAFVELHNAMPEVGSRFDVNPFTKKA
jgi:hypothetical protein